MATQNENKMNRKISEMSLAEIRSFVKPLGFSGLPYPMAKLEKNDSGLSDHTVGAVHSGQDYLSIYSEKSRERVNGEMFRHMPTPSMMFMQRDLFARMAPDSDNFLLSIEGEASAGKTFMFYKTAELVHPEGALKVDCGGMNMHELFFRTVIDYGQGIKEQLDSQAQQGRLQQSTIELLNGAFPNSVIDKGGKAVIDWELIGKPAVKEGAKENESWTDASIRAKAVLELAYSKQGINVQTNAFGIKTVPGSIFEAWESGRPLILDEFNKSKRGTLDTFQTFLQFVNGEKGFDTFTAYNPLAETSDSSDCPKSITLHRKDRKLGWFMGVAGNDKSDGETTQELSVSMQTRLNSSRIGAPQLRDWQHRLSQIYTGLPLTTLYNLFGETAKSNPAEFGQWLVDMRKLGLDEAEIKKIPPHEIHFLKNFHDTVPAMEKLADYYYTRQKFADVESDIYKSSKHNDISDEVSAHGDRIYVSFRKAIADFDKAKLATPEVVSSKGLKLEFNLASLFESFNVDLVSETSPAWHALGKNLSRVIRENIANDTLGMDKTHAALIKVCEDKGVIKASFSGAKANKDFKTIEELLKYDDAAYLENSENLKAIRAVLVAAMKNKYKKISAADEVMIPLSSLDRALQSIKRDNNSDDSLVADGRFVIPNDDMDHVTAAPLLNGFSQAVYFSDADREAVEETGTDLVDYRMALAAFAMPDYGRANRGNIWLEDMIGIATRDADAADMGSMDKELQKEDDEIYYTLMGKAENGFNLTFLEVADEKGKPVYLTILEDKRESIVPDVDPLMLIVGPGKISPQLQGELAKAQVTYIEESDDAFREKVNKFIGEGASFRVMNKKLDDKDVDKVYSRLAAAFSGICGIVNDNNTNEEEVVLPIGTTVGDVFKMADKSKKPGCYKSILKKKA